MQRVGIRINAIAALIVSALLFLQASLAHAQFSDKVYVLTNIGKVYEHLPGSSPAQLNAIEESTTLYPTHGTFVGSQLYFSSTSNFKLYRTESFRNRTEIGTFGFGRIAGYTDLVESYIFSINYSGNVIGVLDLNTLTQMPLTTVGSDNSYTHLAVDKVREHLYYVYFGTLYKISFLGAPLGNKSLPLGLGALKNIVYQNDHLIAGFENSIQVLSLSNFSGNPFYERYGTEDVSDLVDISVSKENSLFALLNAGADLYKFTGPGLGTYVQHVVSFPSASIKGTKLISHSESFATGTDGGDGGSGDGNPGDDGGDTNGSGNGNEDSGDNGGGEDNGEGNSGSNNNCNESSQDSDGDGTPDCQDECPNNPLRVKAGQCGCEESDSDSDGDGVADCKDECPTDSSNTSIPVPCKCGQVKNPDDTENPCTDCSETNSQNASSCGDMPDSDFDGKDNSEDACIFNPFKDEVGLCGCDLFESESQAQALMSYSISSFQKQTVCTKDVQVPLDLETSNGWPAPNVGLPTVTKRNMRIPITFPMPPNGGSFVVRGEASDTLSAFSVLSAKSKGRQGKNNSKKTRMIRKVIVELRKLTNKGVKLIKRKIVKINIKRQKITLRLNVGKEQLQNAILLTNYTVAVQKQKKGRNANGKKKWKTTHTDESRTNVTSVPTSLVDRSTKY